MARRVAAFQGGVPYLSPKAAEYYNAVGISANTAVESTVSSVPGSTVSLASSNFGFTLPILELSGRGLALSLQMAYNTRIWTKDDSALTFDYGTGWPAPGWTLGFGQIIPNYDNTLTGNGSGVGLANAPGNYLLITENGTRVKLIQDYNSSTSLWRHKTNDGSYLQYHHQTGVLLGSDGMTVLYNSVNNRLLPTAIQSRNGDKITITYKVSTSAPLSIDYVTDTLGRVFTFQYNGSGQLTGVTAPGFGGTGTRELMRIDYQTISLQYNFTSSLTVNAPTSGSTISVVKRVYDPVLGKGYVFPDYSTYGMIRKVSKQSGLTSNPAIPGTEIAYTQMDYPNASSGLLSDAPTFSKRSEWWEGKTDSSGLPTITPSDFNYTATVDTVNQIKTLKVASPQGDQYFASISTNAAAAENGLITKEEIRSSSGTLVRSTTFAYDQLPSGILPNDIRTSNELSNTAKVEYAYGSYGRLLGIDEKIWSQVNGDYIPYRTTAYTYVDDLAYINRGLLRLVATVSTYADGALTPAAKTEYTYDNYASTGGMLDYSVLPPNHDATFDETFTVRGNLTGVKQWSDVASNLYVLRGTRYDIFGNGVRQDISCCAVMHSDFSEATWYSQADSETKGTPSVAPFLTTLYEYDFNTGLPTSTTSPEGLVTSVSYDAASWRRTGLNLPSGAYTEVVYGDSDRTYAERFTYQDEASTRIVTTKEWRDGLGRTLRRGTGSGSSPASYDMVATRYDSEGREWKISNPYSGNTSGQPVGTTHWTEYVYDDLSRITEIKLPDGQKIQNQYTGQKQTTIDQVGRKREYTRDGLERLVTVKEQDPATGTLGWTTTYEYDVLNNPIQCNMFGPNPTIGSSAQRRYFQFDGLSRVKSATTPEGGTDAYAYNAWGGLSKKTDARGIETHYGYDELHRLVHVWYTGIGGDETGTVRPALPSGVPATTDTVFNFNNFSSSAPGNGKVQSVTDGSGSQTPQYDSLGRVSRRDITIGTRTFSVNYEYNEADQRTVLVYPSGKRVRSLRDARGRISGLDRVDLPQTTSYVSGAQYDSAGHLTQVQLGNGTQETYSFSADRLQLNGQTVTRGASTLLDFSYHYNAQAGQFGTGTTTGNTGALAAMGGMVNGQNRNQAFAYDTLGRLVGASGWSTWQRSYEYDAWGNRLKVRNPLAGNQVLQNVTLQGGVGYLSNNRIASVTSGGTTTNYTYDAAGNLTADSMNYQYDAENRLVSVNAGAAQYTYNFANKRVKKVAGGVTTFYVWDGDKAIAEYDGNGALSAEYVFLGTRMLAREQGTAVRYFHQDRLSTRLITDGSGAVVGTSDTLPFGEAYASTGESEKHVFTSYERDAETQTDYAMNRQYMNALGRSTRPDPVIGKYELPQTFNRYAYALNDPVNKIDPSGLDYEICIERYVEETGDDGEPVYTTELECSLLTDSSRPAEPYRPPHTGGGGGGGGGGLEPDKPVDPNKELRDDFTKFLKDMSEDCKKALKDYMKKLAQKIKTVKFYDVDALGGEKASKYVGNRSDGSFQTLSDYFDCVGATAFARWAGTGNRRQGVTGIFYRSSLNPFAGDGMYLLLHELMHLLTLTGKGDLDQRTATALGIQQRPGETWSQSVSRFFNSKCTELK